MSLMTMSNEFRSKKKNVKKNERFSFFLQTGDIMTFVETQANQWVRAVNETTGEMGVVPGNTPYTLKHTTDTSAPSSLLPLYFTVFLLSFSLSPSLSPLL